MYFTSAFMVLVTGLSWTATSVAARVVAGGTGADRSLATGLCRTALRRNSLVRRSSSFVIELMLMSLSSCVHVIRMSGALGYTSFLAGKQKPSGDFLCKNRRKACRKAKLRVL